MERALEAMSQSTTSGTRPQLKSWTTKEKEAERMESGSADKEHTLPESEHEHQENERWESTHGGISPDD
jgi:hypothetical protein